MNVRPAEGRQPLFFFRLTHCCGAATSAFAFPSTSTLEQRMPASTAPSFLITSISGTGPLMALDLATAPAAALLPLAQAALHIASEWGNDNITAQHGSAEDALSLISDAMNTLNDLLVPVIPGAPYTTRGDLMDQDTYPIVRNGEVHQVKAADLTPLELVAVHRWLEFHVRVMTNHAEAIKQRLEESRNWQEKGQQQ
jgi:hypothetical protein